MKHSSAVETSSKSKSWRQPVALTGLVLLGLGVWAAGSCFVSQIATGNGISPTRCNWYHRCRVEIRQLVSMMDYLLTPEDDSWAPTVASGITTRPPILGQPTPAWSASAHEVSRAEIATNRPAPPRS